VWILSSWVHSMVTLTAETADFLTATYHYRSGRVFGKASLCSQVLLTFTAMFNSCQLVRVVVGRRLTSLRLMGVRIVKNIYTWRTIATLSTSVQVPASTGLSSLVIIYYFMVLTFGDVFAVIHCNQRKLTIQRAFKLMNVSNLAHSENYRVVPWSPII